MSNVHMTEEQMSRYLAGEASPEEIMAMQQWLEASEDNRRQYEAMQTIWMLSTVERPEETDTEDAWMRMQQRVSEPPVTKRRIIPWRAYAVRAAAVLLLAVGAYAGLQYAGKASGDAQASNEQVAVTEAVPQVEPVNVEPVVPMVNDEVAVVEDKVIVQPAKAIPAVVKNDTHLAAAKKKKEQVCNNTQCPLEICIVQALACDGNAPSMAAHCSILHPNESAPLQYNLYHAAGSCQASIKEVRITRTNTGESIVLNESTPVTAQEFFDYITGHKKGELEAGVFEADCNNLCMNQSIRIDNSFGTLMLQ